MIRKKLAYIFAVFVFCTGCDVTPVTPSVVVPEFITATLQPTAVPNPTQALPPPTLRPTITPLAGTTTSELNVRADTSTASTSLGTVGAFSPVQVIGKDISGLWLQILFADSAGWVRADFVQVETAAAEIPVVEAESSSGSTIRGVVLRGVNVRNGAGKDFESLGLLNQNDVVPILGKDSSGGWIKVEFPIVPDGAGWVAADFLQVENSDAVPVLGETAQPEQTESASAEIPVITSASDIAIADNDSADAPIATIHLSADSARSAQVEGEVSAPEGDAEDWIGFSAQTDKVLIQVECKSGSVDLELINGANAPAALPSCGGVQVYEIQAGQVYLLRITPGGSGYANYELKIAIN